MKNIESKSQLNNKARKWSLGLIVSVIASVVAVGILNAVIDPYFHFHRPITSYRLYDERYINNGISRHFEYDAIITGNSLTQNFSTSQFDELFDTCSIKLPYSGAGYKELWESTDRALTYNKTVKMVLIGMDMEDLDREADWQRYDNLPTYLYDDNIFNDIQYLLNKDALYRGTIYNIILSIGGLDSTSFDQYSSWERKTGAVEACSMLEHIEYKGEECWYLLEDNDRNRIKDNINQNIIPVIEKYPDVDFILIIPPSSVAKWAEYYSKGQIEYRISALEYALPILTQYTNVKVYAFDDVYEITTDLDNYSDAIHYDASINSKILEMIYSNDGLISKGSETEYIKKLRDYYINYDYSCLNKYIDVD